MNVIGIHIVRLDQRRQPFFQTLQRQAVGGVDAGRAQDADGNTTPLPPGTQLALGIDPSAGTGTVGGERPGFVDHSPGAIAVNPRRAYVNQAPW